MPIGNATDLHLYASDPLHNNNIAAVHLRDNIPPMKREVTVFGLLFTFAASAADLDTDLIQKITGLTGKVADLASVLTDTLETQQAVKQTASR